MSQASHGETPFGAMAPTRGLWIIGGGIVALAAVAVVVVLALGNRPAQEFQPGTPERALQEYLAAFDAGDYAAAYGFFSTAARSAASEREYRDVMPAYGDGHDATATRVSYDGRTGSGDRVTLQLTVEQTTGAGGGTFSYSRSVPMVREGGAWRIDQLLIRLDPGPWPLMKTV
jgi:hypothetical protein